MARLVPLVLLVLLGFGCAGPAFETAQQDDASNETPGPEDDARAPDAATPAPTPRR